MQVDFCLAVSFHCSRHRGPNLHRAGCRTQTQHCLHLGVIQSRSSFPLLLPDTLLPVTASAPTTTSLMFYCSFVMGTSEKTWMCLPYIMTSWTRSADRFEDSFRAASTGKLSFVRSGKLLNTPWSHSLLFAEFCFAVPQVVLSRDSNPHSHKTPSSPDVSADLPREWCGRQSAVRANIILQGHVCFY